jgi:glutamate/tyrosine decarboxylase-like PLP-dependent enzyme
MSHAIHDPRETDHHPGSRPRAAPNDLDPADFRAMGHELVDRIADFLSTIADRPVAPGVTPSEIREILDAERSLPARGDDVAAALRETTDLLFSHSTFNGHPRFFGYITSSAAPIGALADMLAATVNPNLGSFALSPAGTEIERQTVRWIAELVGFPVSCGGILVSGGNMANFVCALAALRAQATWDVRAEGIGGGAPLTIYASQETHTWLDKAVDLSGVGTRAVRRIATDDRGRIVPEALARRIEADRADGLIPAFVVGTAGTVSTGVMDPLPELAAICRERSVWFHVDGAYGAPVAALLPDAPAELRAIADADSVAIDPHKWLYAPMEAGCALVRDPEALHSTFRHHPPYYRFDGDRSDPPVNFHEWGIQNSRGFRALKVWLGLRQAGRDGVVRSIAEDIALTRKLHAAAGAHPELEALTCELSISTFRCVPSDLRGRAREEAVATYLDLLNGAVLSASQDAGEVFVSNAVIGGRFALRACIVNFRTTEADVLAVPELLARVGREQDARIRPGELRARPG